MNKVLPFIYFIIGAIWTADAIRVALNPQEQYHIFLDYKTSSLTTFLIFKFAVAVIFLLAGLRRWKMRNQ
jgi:hypothetical protein